ADGFEPATSEVVVAAGEPQTVEIELTSQSRRARPSNQLSGVIGAGGIALVSAGLAYDVLVVQPLRDERAKSRFLYTAKSDEVSRARDITVGLYAAGAIAIGVAVYLAVHPRREVSISAAPDRNGGMIVVGWQR